MSYRTCNVSNQLTWSVVTSIGAEKSIKTLKFYGHVKYILENIYYMQFSRTNETLLWGYWRFGTKERCGDFFPEFSSMLLKSTHWFSLIQFVWYLPLICYMITWLFGLVNLTFSFIATINYSLSLLQAATLS